MKKLVLLLLAATSLFACRMGSRRTGNGNIITQKRTVGEFTGVSASDIISVEVQNGDATSVEVEADDNIINEVSTTVRNGMLEVRFTEGVNHFRNVHIKVFVTAPVLNTLSCSGVGNIKATGVLKSADRINFNTSGTGSITAEVDAPNVTAGVSGVGGIKLSGRTQNYKADVSGSGSIKSYELLSENATAHVSGVGSIHVHASVSLKANVTGVGSVRYRGGANVESSVTGVGSVKKDE